MPGIESPKNFIPAYKVNSLVLLAGTKYLLALCWYKYFPASTSYTAIPTCAGNKAESFNKSLLAFFEICLLTEQDANNNGNANKQIKLLFIIKDVFWAD